MRTQKAIATKLERDEVATWYAVRGTDYGTAWEFEDDDIYGVTDDDQVLDCDGCTLTPGDAQDRAVRNCVANRQWSTAP